MSGFEAGLYGDVVHEEGSLICVGCKEKHGVRSGGGGVKGGMFQGFLDGRGR